MREKSGFQARAHGSPEADPEQVRSDLEDRGIDPEFSRVIAQRLIAIAPDLSEPAYAAILDGVIAAYHVHREISGSNDARFRHGNMQATTNSTRSERDTGCVRNLPLSPRQFPPG